MPLPFLVAGVAAGITGVVKGGEAISNNAEAKRLLEDARGLFENKKYSLERQKEITTKVLDEYGELKIRIWDEQFSRFLKMYNRIKNVVIEGEVEMDGNLNNFINTNELAEMKQLSLTAGEIISGGITSLGAGALAGVASYGGAMMFASASTGTAIASLSGVAATNATLAWFGGGSLAVGGGGMALGTVVLGGLVAGPVLAVGGIIMAAKSKANLAEAKAKYKEAETVVEEMEQTILVLSAIERLTNQYYGLVNQFNDRLIYVLDNLERVINDFEDNSKQGLIAKGKKIFLKVLRKESKIDYNEFSIEEKKALHISLQTVQMMKIILEKSLLTENGEINDSACSYIDKLDNNQFLLGEFQNV